MNEHVVLRVPEAGYDVDFYEWTARQAELLRAGRLDMIDVENLAEEIESLGNSDKRQIVTRMARIIEHLLKLQFSPATNPRADWRASVDYQRLDLELILADSPSLCRRRAEFLPMAWKKGVHLARKGLREEPPAIAALASVAAAPIYTIEQILDEDFFPGG